MGKSGSAVGRARKAGVVSLDDVQTGLVHALPLLHVVPCADEET